MVTLRFRVSGTVEETDSGEPLVGLTVRAFDKDMVFDDYLGSCVTDPLGRFLIQFTDDDFRDFRNFAELDPDLYFRVLSPSGELLHKTPVHRNIGSDENFRIQIRSSVVESKLG